MLSWFRSDDVIDKLIAANAARYLPGMERPDPEQMRRIGWVRWTHVATAQQRQYPEGAMTAEERARERLWEGLEECAKAGMSLKDIQVEIRQQWVEYHRQLCRDAQEDVRRYQRQYPEG